MREPLLGIRALTEKSIMEKFVETKQVSELVKERSTLAGG